MTVLGVALGQLVSSVWNRRSLRRARRRELELLAGMWDAEYVAPTGISDETGRSPLDR